MRNYFLALNYLEEKVKEKERFSKKLILDVQKYVEKGASKEKIALRGAMPQGVLFAGALLLRKKQSSSSGSMG